jgi:hypothetical protein
LAQSLAIHPWLISLAIHPWLNVPKVNCLWLYAKDRLGMIDYPDTEGDYVSFSV